ncbi:hypothetical protein BZA05DRAFT_419927 [Tricharina praecox]|uniref:uncharacterized protein n=1 Tax=Tricharina praecox TaxID=43433 RepID=UPI00221FEA90|nr:uncharacterized protein BZA05DRAFT_419927 [Tricharina praecox]KAI5849247.1 hypothetical protein BZA05DRAFT_419927 [Tricharina praecox]
MLGRLFSTATSTANTSPSGTRPSTSHALESDELYTRNLLYPDSSSTSSVASSFHSSFSLAQSQSSVSSYGAADNVDLEASRDVRVIIAQDAVASEHIKLVVYDSKPSSALPPQSQPPPQQPPHLQGSTGPPLEEGPTSPTLGAPGGGNAPGPLGWSRRRNQYSAGGQHASALGGGGGCVPGGPDDELRVVTDCMFGVAPLSYKGPSTKVHILPAIEERRASVTSTLFPSRSGSVRDDRHKATYQPQQPQQQQGKEKEKRKAVLITRLFSVAVPPCSTPTIVDGGVGGGARTIPQSGSGEHLLSTPASSVGSTNGFPFPKTGGQTSSNGSTASTAPKLIKPLKSSMFAIGLIIYLPPASASPSGSFPMRCCQHKPLLSYDSEFPPHRHEYCCPTPPSFFDDEYQHYHHQSLPAGGLRSGCGLDDLHAAAAASDGRMDLITKHWDVISRALSDLQRIAQARILENLTSARLMSPQPGSGVHGGKYLSNRPELRRMALMRDDVVRSEVERMRWRVVTGISMPRVVVGQGRWDLWQEEAKWANHRFGGRDMNFFFLTLLTSFLGHHTEWLDVLGPDAYKRRHKQQLEARSNPEDSAIPRRTIIMTSDRISARRLIYLLSAFLPAKAHQTLESLPSPSRASSVHHLSQSPPSFLATGSISAPVSNCGSLRRKARKKPSKLNMAVSSESEPDDGVDGAGLAGWTIPTGSSSLSSSSVLPLPPVPTSLRNQRESTGTTLVTLPSSATCVASAPAGARGIIRPGSSGSAASINLMSTLKRSGTTNTSMDSTGWGSFLSFWSNPKSRSSTATSEASLQPEEHVAQQQQRRVTLSSSSKGHDDEEPLDMNYILDDESSQGPPQPFSPFLTGSLPAMEQLSVDDVDGAINVPLDLSIVNFTSPLSSPPSSWAMPHLHSSLGMGRPFVPPPPPTVHPDDDQSYNVAGWIEDERFHPDFVLQAVKPYAEIEADIQRAMRSEPTPASTGLTPWSETGSSSTPGGDKWTTVSEVLIADTKRLQIKRMRLRRRTKKASQSMVTPLQGQFNGYLAVGLEEKEEEIIDEEILVDVDDTLASAVERVIDECEGGKCKDAILGALQRVVGEVVNGDPGARWGGNCLTEGVGRWICGVEDSG